MLDFVSMWGHVVVCGPEFSKNLEFIFSSLFPELSNGCVGWRFTLPNTSCWDLYSDLFEREIRVSEDEKFAVFNAIHDNFFGLRCFDVHTLGIVARRLSFGVLRSGVR